MYIGGYLLFCASIFGSTKFLLADDIEELSDPLLNGLENLIDKLRNNGDQNSDESIDSSTLICEECDEKSLSFFTASAEDWTLTQTGKSVEVIGTSKTNGTVTGGVFGSDLYKYYKFKYVWNTCENNTTFEITVYFFNTKYESFENSLNYPDGLIQVYIPVETNGDADNPQFSKFEPTLQKVKNPGDSEVIRPSEISFSWFKNFPPEAEYEYFRSSYYNEDDGKTYSCATTVHLPTEDHSNFMSRKQFDNTFGAMVDDAGAPLDKLIPPKDKPTSNVKKAKGINVRSV